ncbi:MAG TPA: amidohydrolase family protein [Acidimicrobiales bacterium]
MTGALGEDALADGALGDRGAGTLLVVDVEVAGSARTCVRIEAGRITAVGPWSVLGRSASGAAVLDGGGGAMVAGLRDHHLHLLSLAARRASVACGPPAVRTVDALGSALRRATARVGPGEWVRGVDYDDTVTGPLDAPALDALLGDRADRLVRVQHRSGHAWILNGSAVRAVGLTELADPGVERRGDGTVTGVVYELDRWLGERVAPGDRPDLSDVGAMLARCGVVGLTDATATNGPAELAILDAAVRGGALPQRVRLLGGDDLRAPPTGTVDVGQRKVVLAERDLPELDWLVETVRAAGARGVAIHCVSREALVLAVSALLEAGTEGGVERGSAGRRHRIEHASVAPPDVVHLVRSAGPVVVTQPSFVARHGDRYLREVAPGDLPWLYRVGGWVAAGVPLAGGSDAPFGPADPWMGIRAAVERRTEEGQLLGTAERVTPEQALALYQSRLADPGGPPQRVEPGAPADVCVLSLPWADARRELSSEMVSATVIGGSVVWERRH